MKYISVHFFNQEIKLQENKNDLQMYEQQFSTEEVTFGGKSFMNTIQMIHVMWAIIWEMF